MTRQLEFMVVRRDTHGTCVVMRKSENKKEYAWNLSIAEAVAEVKAITSRQTKVHNQDYAIVGHEPGKAKIHAERHSFLIA